MRALAMARGGCGGPIAPADCKAAKGMADPSTIAETPMAPRAAGHAGLRSVDFVRRYFSCGISIAQWALEPGNACFVPQAHSAAAEAEVAATGSMGKRQLLYGRMRGHVLSGRAHASRGCVRLVEGMRVVA